TVYTDSSCTSNGAQSARAGSSIWYGPDDPRNTAFRLEGQGHTNNTGELAAVLIALQQNKDTKRLNVLSDSKYALDAVTKHTNKWAQIGYIGVTNKELVGAIAGEL
ncbi:ribonuclease H-like protein, partial [Coprinellus micaceus]